MKNMKFRILSPEHSEAIQRELFRLGYDIGNWDSNYCFVIIGFKGKCFTNNYEVFINSDATETTLEELKLMK